MVGSLDGVERGKDSEIISIYIYVCYPFSICELKCYEFQEELQLYRDVESRRVSYENNLIYEGESNEKIPQALVLLLHQIYSSYWGHVKEGEGGVYPTACFNRI